MTIGERLKLARKIAGLTQVQVAQALNTNHTNIHNWETDTYSPDWKTLEELGKILGVTLAWFVTGSDPPTDQAREGDVGYQPKDSVPVRWLPVQGEIPAGPPAVLQEDLPEPMERLPVPDDGSIPKNSFIIKAKGDSMEPRISNGDYLIVEMNPYPPPGSIVVARTEDGQSTVKRLRSTPKGSWLEALNPKYKDKYRGVIWGRVIMVLSKLKK